MGLCCFPTERVQRANSYLFKSHLLYKLPYKSLGSSDRLEERKMEQDRYSESKVSPLIVEQHRRGPKGIKIGDVPTHRMPVAQKVVDTVGAGQVAGR